VVRAVLTISMLAAAWGCVSPRSSPLARDDVQACGPSFTVCPTVANGDPSCDGSKCGTFCRPDHHLCGGKECRQDDDVASCGTSCTACPTDPDGDASCVGRLHLNVMYFLEATFTARQWTKVSVSLDGTQFTSVSGLGYLFFGTLPGPATLYVDDFALE
jgi:hypothetical protein